MLPLCPVKALIRLTSYLFNILIVFSPYPPPLTRFPFLNIACLETKLQKWKKLKWKKIAQNKFVFIDCVRLRVVLTHRFCSFRVESQIAGCLALVCSLIILVGSLPVFQAFQFLALVLYWLLSTDLELRCLQNIR